jgi:hypothetical protein
MSFIFQNMLKIVRIFTISLLILLLSCKEESNQKTIINENLKPTHNDLLNADLYFPKDYKLTSIDDFERKLSESRSNFEITQVSIGSIEKMKSISHLTTLYTDSLNFENYIYITKGEFVDLNKNIATQYSSMLNNSVESNWANNGINFKLLENKYFQKNQKKFVKIKYEQEFNKVKKYLTQYLISGKGKTFSVMVCNFKNEDFEKELKMLKLK